MPKPGGKGTRSTGALTCGECGWQAPDDCGWKAGDTVYHCEGGTGSLKYRGEVHHLGYMLFPLCWKCGRVVGCRKCVGGLTEALCTACAVWTTSEAFVDHGAIVNTEEMLRKRGGLVAPQFDDYPSEYRHKYLAYWGEKPNPIDPKATFKQLVGIYLPR